MRRRYIWAGVIAAFLLLISGATWYIGYANTTHPAPWPMAGGDAGHRHHTKSPLPQQVSLQWTFPLQPTGMPVPPVVGQDGTVFVAIGDRLTAVSPEGKQRWAWSSQTGIFSIALGRQGEVYAQTPEALYAFTVDGQMKWKYPNDFGPGFPMVVGQGGTIYTAGQGYLYAITEDGELKWRFKGGRITSGPVETSRGQILIVLGETLHALSRDGDDLWRIPLKGLNGIMSITALTDDRIFMRADALYISDAEGTLIADQPLDSLGYNTAAGKGFLQAGYTRLDMDGVRTLTIPEIKGAKLFTTLVDDQKHTLLISPAVSFRTPSGMSGNGFVGLALVDEQGQEVWTYKDNPPIDMSGAAVTDDRIYYVGIVDGKSGTLGLIALGNP